MGKKGDTSTDKGTKRTRTVQARAQTQSQAQRSVTPHLLQAHGHPEVIFDSEAQLNRFISLDKKQKVKATRFNDPTFMTTLGIGEMLRNMFRVMGFPSLYDMNELTYPSLVLEFFSSFYLTTENEVTRVHYRLMNNDVNITLAQFGRFMGFIDTPDAVIRPPDHFEPTTFWRLMTAHTEVNTTYLQNNQVEHPALRMFFRILVGTISQKSDVSKVNLTDIALLGSCVNPLRKTPFRIDLAWFFAHHLRDLVSKQTTFSIGGLITWLAKRQFNLRSIEGYACVKGPAPTFDERYLQNIHGWVQRDSPLHYLWRLGNDDEWVRLPSNELQVITLLSPATVERLTPYFFPRDRNLILPGPTDAPQNARPNRIRVGRRSAPASASEPVPAPTPAPMNYGFDNSLPPWFYPQQQFALSQAHFLAQERATYPSYHQQYILGNIPASHPHPVWFDGDTGAYLPDLGIGSLRFDTGYPDDTWPRPPPGADMNRASGSGHPQDDDDDQMDT